MRRAKHSKAILAFAFAGAAMTTELHAQTHDSANSLQPDKSPVLFVEENNSLTPEARAYYLLTFADLYIDNKTINMTEWSVALAQAYRWAPRGLDGAVEQWAGTSSKWAGRYNGALPKDQAKPSKENASLATQAIDLAVKHLGKTQDEVAKLNMYFIAAGMYKKLGLMDKSAACDAVLKTAIARCESNAVVNETQIKGVVSLLNSMASNVIPVSIPDLKPSPKEAVDAIAFTNDQFLESEKLRLRGLALLDRLDVKNQTRWRGHRDMVIWYRLLGKFGLAEKEKLTLFQLVGIWDDEILYPRGGVCGHLDWWKIAKSSAPSFLCGMG